MVNHAPKFNGFLNIAGLALIAASTWYLYWRATETLNPQMYGFSLSLLIAEGVSPNRAKAKQNLTRL
ncbi:MAG: hypothetical protein NTV34_01685 [Proteobacteria bacterium]|nr:hypothetical protein [Pseudomonadota bacterium]